MVDVTQMLQSILTSASSGISKFFTAILIIFIVAGICLLFYWFINKKKYNIVIRGHDRRGDVDFEFDDKAREFISFNQSKLKLFKRKKANVIIPNLKFYRSMITGQRVIHVFKVGAVNDYVVLDPQIVMDVEEVNVMDDKGNPIINEAGEPLIVKRPKFEMHITESLGREHAVLDLRNALVRFSQLSKIEKYGMIIALIIIGLTILLSSWIYGHYMLKSANINLQSVQIASNTAKDILSTIGSIRGGGII